MASTMTYKQRYEAIMVSLGFRHFESGTCQVCTGLVPVEKFKSKTNPFLAVWIYPTKGKFDVMEKSKHKKSYMMHQLRHALALYK